MELNLEELLAPKRAAPKEKSKYTPLPDHEKELTDRPDQMDPQAARSAPQKGQGPLNEFGQKKGQKGAIGLDEAKPHIPKDGPLSTGEAGLNYAINNYRWNYQRFMENWAVALSKRWLAPADYLSGAVPNGGSIWIKVTLSKDGNLMGYEVSDDMTMMVVYAVMGVRQRPPLPDSFPEESLIAYWRFVYPPLAELKAMMEKSRP